VGEWARGAGDRDDESAGTGVRPGVFGWLITLEGRTVDGGTASDRDGADEAPSEALDGLPRQRYSGQVVPSPQALRPAGPPRGHRPPRGLDARTAKQVSGTAVSFQRPLTSGTFTSADAPNMRRAPQSPVGWTSSTIGGPAWHPADPPDPPSALLVPVLLGPVPMVTAMSPEPANLSIWVHGLGDGWVDAVSRSRSAGSSSP
jgi:hypothetical protein